MINFFKNIFFKTYILKHKRKLLTDIIIDSEDQLYNLMKILKNLQIEYENTKKIESKNKNLYLKPLNDFSLPELSHPFKNNCWALHWIKEDKSLIIGYTPEGQLRWWEVNNGKFESFGSFPSAVNIIPVISLYC